MTLDEEEQGDWGPRGRPTDEKTMKNQKEYIEQKVEQVGDKRQSPGKSENKRAEGKTKRAEK